MPTISYYLDTRTLNASKQGALKLSVTKKGVAAFYNLKIYLKPTQWDKRKERVVAHPNKDFLNNYLQNRRTEIENFVLTAKAEGQFSHLSSKSIRDIIADKFFSEGQDQETDNNLFLPRYEAFIGMKSKRTGEIYEQTLRHIKIFAGDTIVTLRFDDITRDWLTKFDQYLQKTSSSVNGRAIHFRNIRAVFNDAIDDEITHNYPFRKFKIKTTQTAKRSLTAEQLKEVFDMKIDKDYEKYRDMFKLIFLLIGINIVDLCRLKKIEDGRIVYHRAKTNRLYSIKVEPEAMEIIEKYKGKDWLLDILDRYQDYRSYYRHLNAALKKLGECKRVGLGGRKVFKVPYPQLSTYWARHTWATLAAELDIPKDTIAAALGHGGNTTTDIYINFRQNKVDDANRRVIDYVLYGKKKEALTTGAVEANGI